MNKILILTTVSQLDRAMAESALIFAKDLKANISLLGTFEANSMEAGGFYNQNFDYSSSLKSKLQEEAARLNSIIETHFSNDFNPKIEVIVKNESLGDAVWSLTKGKEYSMVVMGGKKTESNDSYLCSELLSVTARSKSPVLVIGRDQLMSLS